MLTIIWGLVGLNTNRKSCRKIVDLTKCCSSLEIRESITKGIVTANCYN